MMGGTTDSMAIPSPTAFALTPLNLLLLVLLASLLYLRLVRPLTLPTNPDYSNFPKAPPPILFKTYTPPDLIKYNGENDAPVYLGIRGKVFDVTPGRGFYGPGGPYENFAGRDATRGLACQRFDDDMLTKDLEGPLDKCDDLTDDQIENLNGWEERFKEKYLVIGELVPVSNKRT